MKLAICGFGRIGRQLLRLGYNDTNIDIALINDIGDAPTLTHLLKYDSVHGTFKDSVTLENSIMNINSKAVRLTSYADPMQIPFKELDIDMVFECTGRFTERENAQKLIDAGAKRVMISAPAKNPDATFVYGVNHETFNPETHKIISNASCTTNCLAPVTLALNKAFHIKQGLMTTIHSYTNDQKILDLPHKDLRRARAAAFVCEIEKDVTKQDVNQVLKEASESYLKGVMAYTEDPVVSIDFNGCLMSSTVDGSLTDVMGNKLIKVIAWYDNEVGYSQRMLDLAKYIIKRSK